MFKAKGLLALVLAGSMISVGATTARLRALGMDETDNEGSYYIDDDRNIFLNAANINQYKDLMILEWGSNGQNFTTENLQTSEDNNPKARGGFLKSHGEYVYGVYLGNESNTSSLLRSVATGAYAADATAPGTGYGGADQDSMLNGADNQLDLFFGGSSSVGDWGVNLVYTSDHNQAQRMRNMAHAIRFGMKADQWDGFINLSTGSKSKRVDTVSGDDIFHEFDGKLGIHIGGSYELDESQKIYAMFKKFDWEQTDSLGATTGLGSFATLGATNPYDGQNRDGRGQQGTIEGSFTTFALGYGSQMDLGKGTVFTNVEYRQKQIEVDFTQKAEAKNAMIPVTIGYEMDVTSWLTVRGSIKQNIWGYRENNNYSKLNLVGQTAANSQFGTDTGGKKATLANSTNVNAGATLNFGDIKVEGFVGTTDGDRNSTSFDSDDGVLSLDNLLTRVGMTYSF